MRLPYKTSSKILDRQIFIKETTLIWRKLFAQLFVTKRDLVIPSLAHYKWSLPGDTAGGKEPINPFYLILSLFLITFYIFSHL